MNSRLKALSVHLLTATGAVLSMLALLAAANAEWSRMFLWLVVALNVVFLAAIGQAAVRGLDIVCGCFGRPAAVRGAGYLPYLARDLAFLAAAAWLLWRERMATRAPEATGR